MQRGENGGADFLVRLIVLAAEENVRDRLRVRLFLLDRVTVLRSWIAFFSASSANGGREAAAVAGRWRQSNRSSAALRRRASRRRRASGGDDLRLAS